ncbi:hypothetical protein CMU25_01960 [Elizabethkingia anophelis]|nr:hypothetical protein [Elizabethkingia anophelis]MCT4234483.1 hypothetical protein [Elizabethkingia anophelis]MDV3561030.1 hypothetical protein [Elizabethkingia anophelis]MDV3768730.1 hypothetical protein [Elizabethkingia anophelis]MDV3777667.1 hypothetical protein [Elizabethkingia anophelis]
MKILRFYLASSIFALLACKNSTNNTPYFSSNEIYKTVIYSTKNLDKKYNFYYIFTFSDTLAIVGVDEIGGCLSCVASKKIGYFDNDNSRIILTKPISPKYHILKKENGLKYSNAMNGIDTSFNRNPMGILYKINNINDIKQIYKGNMSEFINKKEYQLQIPKE